MNRKQQKLIEILMYAFWAYLIKVRITRYHLFFNKKCQKIGCLINFKKNNQLK